MLNIEVLVTNTFTTLSGNRRTTDILFRPLLFWFKQRLFGYLVWSFRRVFCILTWQRLWKLHSYFILSISNSFFWLNYCTFGYHSNHSLKQALDHNHVAHAHLLIFGHNYSLRPLLLYLTLIPDVLARIGFTEEHTTNNK